MKSYFNRWMNVLTFFHFTLLPFGSLDFGNPYLNINFITSILFILSINVKIFKIYRIKYVSSLAIFLTVYWLYLIFISFLNYNPNVVTAGSELRMQTLFIFTFFAMFIFFFENTNKIYLINKYLKFGISALVIFTLLGIGVKEVGQSGRISTFGMNPNFISYFMLYFFFINLNDFFVKNKYEKYLIIIFNLLTLIVIARLGSLSALGNLVLGLGLFFLFKEKKFIKKIQIAVLSSIIIIPAIIYLINTDVYYERLNDQESLSDLSSRKSLWEMAINEIEKNPVFGVGVYENAKNRYQTLGLEISYHNVFLDLLVNTGLIGFSFFILFYLHFVKINLKIFNKTQRSIFIVFATLPIFIVFSGQFALIFYIYILSSVEYQLLGGYTNNLNIKSQ